MVESKTGQRSQSQDERQREQNTQVVYNLVLENLKRAVELSLSNQETEKAINKKTNLNYRLRQQIEEGKGELKNLENEGESPQQVQPAASASDSNEQQPKSYLSLAVFSESDHVRGNEIMSSDSHDMREKLIDLVQSLANRCSAANKELEKELRSKQKEHLRKQRLNSAKDEMERYRTETRKTK